MRVISGEYRSLLLKSLQGEKTRPTLAKVKGAVFNHLGPQNGKSFLDLFSGSGAIGIEALSRGAEKVIFVDSSSLAIAIIKENLANIKIKSDRYDVYNLSYKKLLKEIDIVFDFFYLEPPFASDFFIDCLKLIYHNNILKPNGEIMIESELDVTLDNSWFKIVKTIKYGRVKITYLVNN